LRVPIALLAEFALAHADGRLYVTGGGIRFYPSPTFPATISRLSFAIGVEFESSDLAAVHTVEIRAVGPTGDSVVKPVTMSFKPLPNPSHPYQPVYFHFVYNMENVVLPTEGEYSFSVLLDGNEAEAVPLRAVMAEGPVPAALESRIRLAEGVEAFGQGDAARAEAVFRDLVARFPGLAEAYNNLGFVLLANGDPAGALDPFKRAAELGFERPELLDANIACCHYLMDHLAEAVALFRQCIEERSFPSGAILFGIKESELFVVRLLSAADYASLMMLNAAWSARRAGDRDASARYVEGAEAAELSRRDDEGGKHFSLSVQALKSLLAGDERLSSR